MRSATAALEPEVLDRLAHDLTLLRGELIEGERDVTDLLNAVHEENRRSARNLVHYLALRRHDLRPLQRRLANAGLSSLGRSEAHVMATIDRVIGILALARGQEVVAGSAEPVGYRDAERLLSDHACRMLGRARDYRAVRIVVTLPEEAASDQAFVGELFEAGMDCARINCARGDASQWNAMAENVLAVRRLNGGDCRILADVGGRKLRTGMIADGSPFLLLRVGDRFHVTREGITRPGFPAALPSIDCTTAEVFRDAKVGEEIWFNDGKLGGIIREVSGDHLLVDVTSAKPKGTKLRPDRGINLPRTALRLPALTDGDLSDLRDVAPWADAIELSYVQDEEDVRVLFDALRDYGATDTGVVLKIETRRAFENLPRLLLAAMRAPSCGVMIARGDLAVESGFERLAEVQEEILWISEAAHVPTIWATQVLENLSKKGSASRAEITDAAMSSRAEAVLLSKGPFLLDSIRTMNDILHRMRGHQMKKRSLYRALSVSENLWREDQQADEGERVQGERSPHPQRGGG